MSSYFSQLIQQTGIALPTGTVRARDAIPDIFSDQSSEEGALIQEEHREVIVPQPEQPVFPVTQSDRDRSIVHKTIIHSPDNTSTSKAVQPDHLPRLSGEGEQPPIASDNAQGAIADSPNPKPTILEQIEVQSFVESIPISQASQQQETENDTNTVTNPPSGVAAQPLEQQANVTEPEPIELVQIERKVEAVRKAETRADALPTRQAYLQAVRDWVGSTPGEIEELQEVYTEQQPQPPAPSSQKPAIAVVSSHVPEPFSLEQISQSEPQQPEEQDFVLSIGRINLTIEAPQSEVFPPPASHAQSEPIVKPNYQTSRLSRYYLRLR